MQFACKIFPKRYKTVGVRHAIINCLAWGWRVLKILWESKDTTRERNRHPEAAHGSSTRKWRIKAAHGSGARRAAVAHSGGAQR